MIKGPLNLPQDEAIGMYGWLTTGIVISQLVGALLGDFLVGNKPMLIIGASLQTLGACLMSTGNLTCLYIAIGCISIGGGFYRPNLISCFGREYQGKSVLNDGGFSYLYFVISLGAMVGTLLISSFGGSNFTIGFVIAGALLLLSAIIPLLIKREKQGTGSLPVFFQWNIKAVVLIIFSAGGFWFLYDLIFANLFIEETTLPELIGGVSFEQLQNYVSTFISLFTGIIFAVIWSNFSMNSFMKVTIGLLFAALATAMLCFNQTLMPDGSEFLLMGSIFGLSFAEIFIGPFLFSILNQSVPSRYLAIFVAISMLLIEGFNKFSSFLSTSIHHNSMLTFGLALIIFIVLGIFTLMFTIQSQRAKRIQHDALMMDIDSQVDQEDLKFD